MKMTSLIIMTPDQLDNIFGPDQIRQIEELTDLLHPPLSAAEALERPDLLFRVRVIFGGWGTVCADRAFLERCPELQAFFYAAGSIRQIVTPAFWERNILITSAYQLNALPVAEFCFAQIILALKKAPQISRICREEGSWRAGKERDRSIPGCYKSTVGLVSLGMIGCMVLDFLGALDVEVLVYDINRDEELAGEKGFRYCSLEDLFAQSDVVSLHTAHIPATVGMISRELLSSMKEGASLINTARGAIVDEPGLAAVLMERPDLSAFLDVLTTEPPEKDNPLLSLSNAYLTPHIAGSQMTECRRMGDHAIEECRRFLQGDEPRCAVNEAMMMTMA